jgi:hypothetical protein
MQIQWNNKNDFRLIYSITENGKKVDYQVTVFREKFTSNFGEVVNNTVKSSIYKVLDRYLKHRYQVYKHLKIRSKLEIVVSLKGKLLDCHKLSFREVMHLFVNDPNWKLIEPKKPNCWTIILQDLQLFINQFNN